MPPSPVTTTNDRKTMASAIPGARMPDVSKSLACAQPHGNHWSVNATNRNTKTAHGSTRRHLRQAVAMVFHGLLVATERPSLPRLRPITNRRTTVRMNGIAARSPARSLRNPGRMVSP